MQTYEIQCFTYGMREETVPRLSAAVTECGAWLAERKTTSANALELLVELQLRSVLDLYAALAGAGIELTRSGQAALTGLCARRKHLGRRGGASQLVAVRLEVRFMEDTPLTTILSGSSGVM